MRAHRLQQAPGSVRAKALAATSATCIAGGAALYQWALLGGPSLAGNFGLGLLVGGAMHQLQLMAHDLAHEDTHGSPLPISNAALKRTAPLVHSAVIGAIAVGVWMGRDGLGTHSEATRCAKETAMVLGIVGSTFVNALMTGRLKEV